MRDLETILSELAATNALPAIAELLALINVNETTDVDGTQARTDQALATADLTTVWDCNSQSFAIVLEFHRRKDRES